ncbi:hypothetical protein JWZ97_07645 [Methylococcus sp. EFPC2]|nr:hypothetical protein JWZ97_07645 [Methylococcus sp. EFPC2]
MPRKYSLLLLAGFIVLLYVSLNKVIVPFVMKVMDSELFLEKEDEEEPEELGKISNERSGYAFLHCKQAVKEEKSIPENSIFNDKDYEAWALGGKAYLIRGHVTLPAGGEGPADRKFGCKIKLEGKDAADAASWSILGVDFNEPD